MSKLLPDDVKEQIRQILSTMQNPIKILYFSENEGNCQTCSETKELLSAIEGINDKVTLIEKDRNTDKEDAEKYGITMAPSFVLLDDNETYKGVKFNGIPAGHEINSFISALLEMAGTPIEIDEATKKRIAAIKNKVNIKVFITLSCPHCPGAVQNAHRLSMLNDNIEGEMIEAQTFQAISQKYDVSGVPKIVINDKHELVGNQPLETILDQIEAL